MNFSQLNGKLHASNYKGALKIQLIVEGPVSWQEKELPPSKVSAYESAGFEGNRNADSPRSRLRKLQATTVPGAPTNLYLQSETISSFLLSWTPPNDNGGSPIISYTIDQWDIVSFGWYQIGSTS